MENKKTSFDYEALKKKIIEQKNEINNNHFMGAFF